MLLASKVGAHTFSAYELLLKWPGQNDLPVLKKMLNIFMYWVYFVYTIYIRVPCITASTFTAQ